MGSWGMAICMFIMIGAAIFCKKRLGAAEYVGRFELIPGWQW